MRNIFKKRKADSLQEDTLLLIAEILCKQLEHMSSYNVKQEAFTLSGEVADLRRRQKER